MIDIHLLRYALAAADSGSFSRAAERFGVKQSTLSRHVQYLEDRLGLTLFRRSSAGVVPTDPGRHFLLRARRIVDDVETLDADSRAYAAGSAGSLRLGFQSVLDTGNLGAVLRDYQAACPAVAIEGHEDDSVRLLDRVESGQLDLAILSMSAPRAALHVASFWSEPVLIGVPAGHPLEKVETLHWSDLRQECFAVTAADPGPGLAALIRSRLPTPAGHPAISVQHVSRANLGVTANMMLTVSLGPPNLVSRSRSYHRVNDALGTTLLEQHLHWNPHDAGPVLRHFLDFVAHRFGQHGADARGAGCQIRPVANIEGAPRQG